MPQKLESPWREFLDELDSLLAEPLVFHCIGGFAIAVAYGLKRATNDLDYFTLVPCNISHVQELAGEGSPLARKYKVHVQHAPVASLPENYEERMTELAPALFQNIKLFILDPYDLILSKLDRNAGRDREDVEFLAKTLKLNPGVLRERYKKEWLSTGPREKHDKTIDFWIDAFLK